MSWYRPDKEIKRLYKKTEKEVKRFTSSVEREARRNPEITGAIIGAATGGAGYGAVSMGAVATGAAVGTGVGYGYRQSRMMIKTDGPPIPMPPPLPRQTTVMAAERASSLMAKRRKLSSTVMGGDYGALNVGAERLGT